MTRKVSGLCDNGVEGLSGKVVAHVCVGGTAAGRLRVGGREECATRVSPTGGGRSE